MTTRAEKHLNAAVERLSKEGDDRVRLSFVAALAVGGRLGWEGSPSRQYCEDALTDAAGGKKYRRSVRDGLRKGARSPLPEPNGKRPDRATNHHPTLQTRAPDYKLTPTWVCGAWHGLAPIHASKVVSEYLRSRGIDPIETDRRGLARALPNDHGERFSRWEADGRRLVCAVFDKNGKIRSLKGRIMRPPRDKNEAKSKGIWRAQVRRSVLACDLGRRLLAKDPAAIEATRKHGVIFVEGEPDHLTWAIARNTGAPVFGVFNGAWCDDFARRIPNGTNVYLRPHADPAGRSYMKSVALSVKGRCHVWAPPLPSPAGDENDQLLAGTLPAHPRDDSSPYLIESDESFVSAGIPISLDAGRTRLTQTLGQATREGGIHVVKGGTGIGKTHRAVRHVVGQWDSGANIGWLVREDSFAEEAIGKPNDENGATLRAAAHEMLSADRRRQFLKEISGSLDTGRNANNCNIYDNGLKQAARAAPGGAAKVCAACPERRGCKWLLRKVARDRLKGEGRITIRTHAKEVEAGTDSHFDLLIVDEDPTGSMFSEQAFTAADVATWDMAGDLGTMTPEQSSALIAAIVASGAGERPTFDLAPFFDGVALGDSNNAADLALERIKNDPHGTNSGTETDWHSAAPWRALRALKDSAEGRIENGQAIVTRVRTGAIGNARTTIVLDATATPPRTAALFGKGAHFHDINTVAESQIDATHISGFSPSRHNLNPTGNRLTWLRVNTALDPLVKRSTLVVLPKKVREILQGMADPPRWFNTATQSGHIVHYGQAGSSGTNKHRECTEAVVFPRWIPAAGKAARCLAYAKATGTEPEFWEDEVTYETEVSPVIQGHGRARKLQKVFILGGKRTYGLRAIATPVQVDLYNYTECGGPFRGKACFEAAIRSAIERSNGCTVLSANSLVSHAIGDPPNIYYRTLPNGVGHPNASQITEALRDHYGGSWWKALRAAGIEGVRVETSKGGKGYWIAWEGREQPPEDVIVRALLEHVSGITWYQIPGGVRSLLEDPLAKYREAIRLCAQNRWKPTARRLGEIVGVSKSTAGRLLKDHGEEVERLCEAAKVPRRKWVTPHAESISLRARVRSRTRDRVPPVWHSFLAEHGYLIGRVPTARGIPPTWVALPRGSSASFPMRPN